MEFPRRLQPHHFRQTNGAQSVFGYEPRIFTKLQCLPRILIAPATFLSCAWPSQSMKKKYSHALRLLGRDSIFVMLILNLRNAAMASCSAPTLSETLTIKLVRSSPVGGLHWRPRTRKRVAFAALSWMSCSKICNLYFSAAKIPAIAAVFFSFAASSAERALDDVSIISTRGKWF